MARDLFEMYRSLEAVLVYTFAFFYFDHYLSELRLQFEKGFVGMSGNE